MINLETCCLFFLNWISLCSFENLNSTNFHPKRNELIDRTSWQLFSYISNHVQRGVQEDKRSIEDCFNFESSKSRGLINADSREEYLRGKSGDDFSKKKSTERCYNFWKKEIGRKGDGDILFINVWNFSRSKKWNFDYVENRIRFGERIEFVES